MRCARSPILKLFEGHAVYTIEVPSMKLLTSAVVLVVSVLLSVASLSADTRVYVRVGPPGPRHEVVVIAPGPGYVWVPG